MVKDWTFTFDPPSEGIQPRHAGVIYPERVNYVAQGNSWNAYIYESQGFFNVVLFSTKQ